MNLSRVALAGAFALSLGGIAQAQTYSPSPIVPKLGNSQPANPVATDGSPLPYNNTVSGTTLLTGRSAYVDPIGGVPLVGGIVGTGVGAAGSVVDTGLGLAGGAVNTGAAAVGGIVGGSVNTVDGVVR